MGMRRFFVILLYLLTLLSFSIKLLNPFGPTILPISFILKGDVGKEIDVSFWKSPEEAVAAVKAAKANFYILPITLGANLYNKGFDLVLLGVHEWKVFYLVARGKIPSLKDLKGRKIYVTHSRGTVLDVLLRYFLERSGMKPDVDVKLVYAQPNEIVALFKAGKIEAAALPEPFATMALSSGGRIVLDFQKMWSEMTGLEDRIPIAGLFTTKEMLKEHPLESEYTELALWVSTALMNEHRDAAVETASKFIKMPKRILENSLKRMVFYYVPIEKCKEDVERFLMVLHEKYPEGLSKVPDEGFYK